MSTLQIPESDAPLLYKFLQEKQAFFDKVGESLKTKIFSGKLTQLKELVSISGEHSQIILRILISYVSSDKTPQDFLDSLYSGYRDLDLDEHESKEIFSSKLLAILLNSEGIKKLLKARELALENQKTYTGVRVLTDVRPIFLDSQSDDIIGGIVIHQLKLSFKENNEDRELYIVLDSSELKELIKNFERAIDKEKAVKLKMKGEALDFIEFED